MQNPHPLQAAARKARPAAPRDDYYRVVVTIALAIVALVVLMPAQEVVPADIDATAAALLAPGGRV